MLNLRNIFLLILFLHPTFQNLNEKISGGMLAVWSPFGVISITVTYLAFIYLIIKKEIIIKGLALFIPFFLLLCFAFMSIFVSDFPVMSLRNFAELASFFVIYILSANIFSTEKKMKLLIKTIIFSSVIPLAIALGQLIFAGGSYWGSIFRVEGTLGGPNSLAFYLLCVFPLLAVSVSGDEGRKRSRQNVFMLFLVILAVAMLLFTYTRTAWIAFTVQVFMLWYFGRRRIGSLIAILILFAIAFLAMPNIIARMSQLTDEGGSFYWRLTTWRALLQIALKKPLLGYGIGTSALIYEKFGYQLAVPHNDYLRVFLETGALGIITYAWLWFSILVSNRYFYRKSAEDVFLKKISTAFMTISVAYMIASTADNFFNNSVFLWPFFCIAGALGGFYRKQASVPKSENKNVNTMTESRNLCI